MATPNADGFYTLVESPELLANDALWLADAHRRVKALEDGVRWTDGTPYTNYNDWADAYADLWNHGYDHPTQIKCPQHLKEQKND